MPKIWRTYKEKLWRKYVENIKEIRKNMKEIWKNMILNLPRRNASCEDELKCGKFRPIIGLRWDLEKFWAVPRPNAEKIIMKKIWRNMKEIRRNMKEYDEGHEKKIWRIMTLNLPKRVAKIGERNSDHFPWSKLIWNLRAPFPLKAIPLFPSFRAQMLKRYEGMWTRYEEIWRKYRDCIGFGLLKFPTSLPVNRSRDTLKTSELSPIYAVSPSP